MRKVVWIALVLGACQGMVWAAPKTPEEVIPAVPDPQWEQEEQWLREQQAKAVSMDDIDLEKQFGLQQTQIDSDNLYYSDLTGAVRVRGNVEVKRGTSRLTTELMTGNYLERDYRIPGWARWEDTTRNADILMTDLTYTGKTDTATLATAEGRYNSLYVVGEGGIYHPTMRRGTLAKAMVTTPSAMAKVPDYRMEAEDIQITDNSHLVAHNASFYIKNHRIFSLKTYKTKIGRGGGKGNFMSFLPRPSFSSGNGFGLKAEWEYPVSRRTDAFIRYEWHSKQGFMPDIGVTHRASLGNLTLHYVKEESVLNEDSIWIKKRPELLFQSRSLYFGNSPVYAYFGMDWGYWIEGNVKGSHIGWQVGMSTDALRLDRHWSIRPRVGYWRDYYGYDDSQRGNMYAGVSLYYSGHRWQGWGGYIHNHYTGTTPYHFDRPDVFHRAYAGVKYQIDRLNAVGVDLTMDTSTGKLVHEDYTWYRDLHSFTAELIYRAKDNGFKLRVRAKDF